MDIGKIEFEKEEIRNGLLRKFYEICPGALEVYMVLWANASEKNKTIRISIKTICTQTGISLCKVVGTLNKLKEVGFIEAPFEGQMGRRQLYKLKEIY